MHILNIDHIGIAVWELDKFIQLCGEVTDSLPPSLSCQRFHVGDKSRGRSQKR